MNNAKNGTMAKRDSGLISAENMNNIVTKTKEMYFFSIDLKSSCRTILPQITPPKKEEAVQVGDKVIKLRIIMAKRQQVYKISELCSAIIFFFNTIPKNRFKLKTTFKTSNKEQIPLYHGKSVEKK